MTETAVAKVERHEPVIVLTREDIKKYICPTADDKEIFMFLGICKSFGLNPLKREVHLIKYGNAPASIVTGYEVYLKRAERTGKLNGWKVDIVQDGKAATVTIHRKDWNQPFEWTAYRQEFDKGQANWKTMPLFMLRKVAMAQAFRICFPDEMGGLPYLPEEISGHVSESLPTGPMEETPVSTPVTVLQDAPQSIKTPTVTIGAVQIPLVPPLPAGEKKDDATLRHEIQELAAILSEAYPDQYPDVAHAIYFATAYTTKDGKEAGYKDVLKLKGWQMIKAIDKLNARLNALPLKPTDDDVIPEDVPY